MQRVFFLGLASALALGLTGCGGDDGGGGSGGSSTGGTGGATGGTSGTGGSTSGGSGGGGGVAGSGGAAGGGGAAGSGGATGGTGGATGGTGGATGGTGGATGGTGGATGGTGGTGTGGTGTGGTGTGGSAAFWPNAYNASCTPAKSSPTSHSGFTDMECLSCHKAGGAAAGKNWRFGGVVLTAATGGTGAQYVEVGIKDGTNFIYACTDSKGFFYADEANTTAPTWANAEIRIRSAAGEKKMATKAIQAGGCNASTCHGALKLVKP